MTPVVLLILDGWGIAPPNRGNAIELAKKPNFDRLWEKFPHTTLKAHGHFVGLPDEQVGNSEAGHINIGAGRCIEQDSTIISESISDGRFKKNLAFREVFEYVKKNKSGLHLLGLVSDGDSPHSSLDHLYELVNLAYNQGLRKIYLHLITDGRDSAQFSALNIVDTVLKNVYGKATIASLIGRFYAMDRAKNWERTEAAYDCLVGTGGDCFADYRDAILHAYNQKITDEFIFPAIICKDKKHSGSSRVKDNDAIIFYNLRSDRARQLTKCFVQNDFNKKNKKAFKRSRVLKNTLFCAFTDFGPDLDHILTAFPCSDIENTLPSVLSKRKQVYIAETEKYAHVTYFINGGFADPVNGEERLRIASPKVRSYDLKPEMSVYAVTDSVLKYIEKDFNFITVNFANPDMVGHTGNLEATVKAIEHVDACIGKISQAVMKKNGCLIITADHGNAEKKIDLETNEIWAQHTTNPVPFILADESRKGVKLKTGSLGNIAPTIYEIMNQTHLPRQLFKSLIL
ncbi:MAG: 2,3-bisphosphoglycerate-independent phosphoglycerate mutase [Patescibacteria group bacterium]